VNCLRLPPGAAWQKLSIAAAYLASFFISLAFIAYEATLSNDPRDNNEQWVFALFGGIHSMSISPVVAVLGLAALLVQGCQIRSKPSLGALSVSGLWIQALVFALVGVSWLFRFTIPRDFWRMHPTRAATT